MNKLYFRQLLSGVDFAVGDDAARQMANFVYLIGDKEKKECLVVDPAWDIEGILQCAKNDGMKITGVLVTHYHPDHIGGNIFGLSIEGLKELMSKNPCKIHAHKLEKSGIIKITGLSSADILAHESHDIVKVGDVSIELLHTPGHTPGSMCFRLKDALVSGDTLFLRGCGRVDLPGGDVNEMHRTIHERLSAIASNTIVYPGHNYHGESDSMEHLRKTNPVFKHLELSSFLRYFHL